MSDEELIAQEKMNTWISSFERAIVKRFGRNGLSKNLIDSACSFAVEEWTERLLKMGKIQEIKGREFPNFKEAIEHHVTNLITVGTWTEKSRPTIDVDEEQDNLIFVDVPVCEYRVPCEESMNRHDYHRHTFPCQRMGSFVGAIKKYLSDEAISESDRKNISYFMTHVHQETGCNGVLFKEEGFLGRLLEKHHLTDDENDL